MNKIIFLLFILFLSNNILIAQNSNEKFSIKFKDESFVTAIKNIETTTSYKFYFDPTWVETNKTLITGDYTNITIHELLEKILNKTDLNFVVIKKKIILTLNNQIHDGLPSNYFADTPVNQSEKLEENIETPVFYQQYDSLKTFSITKKTALIFIGKENKESVEKISLFLAI